MSMAVAARTGRRLWEATAWSLIVAALIVTMLFLGSTAAQDLSDRGTKNCRKALGLKRGPKVQQSLSKRFSFSPLGWTCVYDDGGSKPVSSFVEL